MVVLEAVARFILEVSKSDLELSCRVMISLEPCGDVAIYLVILVLVVVFISKVGIAQTVTSKA